MTNGYGVASFVESSMRWLTLGCVTWFAVLPFTFADDWRQWRGPSRDNHAPPSEGVPPDDWTTEEGFAWKTPVPGRGHSSPIVVGNRIYLTTCDEQATTQSLLVFDRKTGDLLASPVAHTGGLAKKIHPHNTHASPTPASDGERVLAMFNFEKAVWITAYDLEGRQLWQTRVAGFDPQQFPFGLGSSPIVHDKLVIMAIEYEGEDSGVYGIDKSNGQQVWQAPRPGNLSNSTPVLATLGDKPQLLLSGHGRIASYDPETGAELWQTPGAPQATCGTMVWDDSLDLAFASGGFPESITMAVSTKGDHKLAWSNRAKCYEQSMLVADGYLYAVTDSGIAYCWRAKDGEEMWKQRLGGKYSSSPLLVGDRIYVSNEAGTTFVFAASPEEYKPLGKIQMGDEIFATPAAVDGKIYYRYADSSNGERQEFLMAVGE
jgi:outer membrane protein assembly factor BamB